MNRLGRILLITFVESFATICLERGIYFYSVTRLGFSDVMNLWLALAFGLAYVTGALLSHPIASRLKEKRLITVLLILHCVVHLMLALWIGPTMLFVGSTLLGMLNGLKWPVIESYVSAGRTPKQTLRAVGIFSITWAFSVPLALAAAGPLIELSASALFLVPAVLNVIALGLSRRLPQEPIYLPHEHPDRPSVQHLTRLKALLNSSRWLLLASYSAMWVLAALLPRIFRDMGFVVAAPALSGVLEAVRLVAFVMMWFWLGWCGRAIPIYLSVILLPVGFFMILFGENLPVVLGGEVLFGISMGLIYYSSLYYAMIVKNASVDAGGGHESLIGAGFAIGPAAGLIAVGLVPLLGSQFYGMIAGIAPVFVVCSVGALWAIRKELTSKTLATD